MLHWHWIMITFYLLIQPPIYVKTYYNKTYSTIVSYSVSKAYNKKKERNFYSLDMYKKYILKIFALSLET